MAEDRVNSPETVLLDLDGTLTDPYPGIAACVMHAMDEQGLPYPTDPAAWIGPPIQHSFERHCRELGEGDPARLLRDYRARFDAVGWRENRVYDGIPEALEQLAERGHRMLLATAKPEVFALRIVEHFGLVGWLEAVHGSKLDGRRGDKTDLLRHIIIEHELDPANCVMVGDRKHDAIAARNLAMPAIGVLWGYGGREELLAAGTQRLLSSPPELPDAVASRPGEVD